MNFLSDYFNPPRPLTAPRPIHCVFYSHIWTVYALAELALVNPKTDIILELAAASHFAAALNPFNSYHESLPSLLQTNKYLHQLGGRFKDIAAPLVLAPAQAVAMPTLLAALALVRSNPSPVNKAVVMVHINDAATFAAAYSEMSRFSILWDIADQPNASLPALAHVLVAEDCMDAQRWGGIHLCQHPHRRLPDHPQRETALKQLLAEFPLLSIA